MYVILQIFTILNSTCRTKFFNYLKSPDGLSITCVWPGCNLVECYSNINQIILLEKWDSKQLYEKYMKMRTDTGLFNLLNPLLKKPYTTIELDENIELNSPYQTFNHPDIAKMLHCKTFPRRK